MNDSIFLIGVGLAACAGGLVVLTLGRPLRAILMELCGTSERALFWSALSRVLLVAVPLIFALQFVPEPSQEVSVVVALGTQLKWALIGVVTAAVALGMLLLAFIPWTPGQPVIAPAPATAHAPYGPAPNQTIADRLKG